MTIQEVAIVVDRSGSMAGKETDTVGGINTTDGNNSFHIKYKIKYHY